MNTKENLKTEFLGTFIITFLMCFTGLFVLRNPQSGVGYSGAAIIYVFAQVLMLWLLQKNQKGYFNPAISIGLAVAGKLKSSELPAIIFAQVIGAIAACALLWGFALGRPGYQIAQGLGANGFAEHSPMNFSIWICFAAETLATALVMWTVLEGKKEDEKKIEKSKENYSGLIKIGIGIFLAALITLPITGASLNPARSTGPAVFELGWSIEQLWLFWLAPILGATLVGKLIKVH